MSATKLFLVLPIYNEQENLPALLTGTEATFDVLGTLGYQREYVLVDDGSTDQSPQIIAEHADRLPITVITHSPNQGLGPTIRDGLACASGLAGDDDIIFAMDADNTHTPDLMIRMTRRILEGNDVVIASRYQPGAQVVGLSWFRKLMSTGARVLFRLLLPIPGVRDYTCGYRAYRAGVLKEAFRRYGGSFIEHQGFQCMADILIRLSKLEAVIGEVPMILRYDLKGGQSKMRVGTTVLNTLKLLIRRRFQKAPPETAPTAGTARHDARPGENIAGLS